MEYVLNELSLCGQFESASQFAKEGMTPLIGVLKTLFEFGVSDILKKSSFYENNVTIDKKLYQITGSRMSLPLLAVCSYLSRMQGEPYWDTNPRQDVSKRYLLKKDGFDGGIEEIDITRSGVAEVYARQGCLISYRNDGYDELLENVRREDEADFPETGITNLHDKKETEEFLFESGQIDFKSYIKSRYSTKLMYDELSDSHGLNLVSKSNFRQFFASFKDFEAYSWQQIITSDGFDYKEFKYNKQTKNYFTPEQWRKSIHKFRISSGIRCFGYREGENFHLLRIDLDHILSDKG